MSEITKSISEIGEITFAQSKRAKKIGISIRPWKGIRVYFPPCISFTQAEKFVQNRKNWIKKNLSKVENYEENRPTYSLNEVIETDFHDIKISESAIENFKVEQNKSKINILIPKTCEITNNKIQSNIRAAFIEIYRSEAKQWFPPRVEKYAQKYNFNYNNIYIKSQKTIWGSCSSKRNINLNLNLMRLNVKFRDYIILHELTHLWHPNHSQKFWTELAKYIDNPRKLDRKLKKHNPRRYQP